MQADNAEGKMQQATWAVNKTIVILLQRTICYTIILCKMTNIQAVLNQRLTDALKAPIPVLTRRDIRLPQVPGKALAVVGMRRAGRGRMQPRVRTSRVSRFR